MEKTLFSFIWKYSKREQLFLLGFTIFTFPFLYATLELPKRIINDAIGAQSPTVSLPFGFAITQTQFLLLLCFAYLAAVLAHGLMKMRLNTLKGILSERMLRRFRYRLISRMMRFPRSYYRNTSQGELVAMVTSEAEPMGGVMGDAVAQPVFQAGQMLIIVVFLFVQSVWFGLAGIALIPLQAWVVPILQRQINLLNKERIVEIRHFAGEIGETAAGITDLRTNAGWRYRLAAFTERLGTLYAIRFKIYQKKFFMKFLNNFITQLTPFFFYAVGGYLAITGSITVGALVAALAAYKDLSAPWKELLDYYNQIQDMSLRWEVVCERFAPQGMIDEALFEGEPDELPHLAGPILIHDVTVRNDEGNPVLQQIDLEIPKGATVAIQSANQAERTAFAELLTRELLPARGSISFNGHELSELHQAVIATRIGYAHSRPYFFDGTLGDNLLMSLRFRPTTELQDPKTRTRHRNEAEKSGNSTDSVHADWIDPELAGLSSEAEVRDWWFRIAGSTGSDEGIFRRTLRSRIDPDLHPELAQAIVGLREEVYQKLVEQGVDGMVNRFDPEAFNPSIPLGGNLLFAAPRRSISQKGLVAEKKFLELIVEEGLAGQGIAISQTLIETLHQTFGMDGTGHPLFTALGIEEEMYERLVDIAMRRREKGDQALDEEEFALLLTVPFAFTAEQIGPAFPESFKREILAIRKARGAELRERSEELFIPIAMENYLPRLTVLENLLYGRISAMAGLHGDVIEDIVTRLLDEHKLRNSIAQTIWDLPVGLGGTNLPATFQERLAFGRAAIKRPDVLILDQTLASHSAPARKAMRSKLGELLPDSTLIFMEERFENPDAYDLFVEIKNGRINGVSESAGADHEDENATDLKRKLRAISNTDLFADIGPRNQRLLAFTAQWYNVPAGRRVFSMGEKPDAAYLCVSGRAILGYHDDEGEHHDITTVGPGRLIGDLQIILDEPRQNILEAVEDCQFLRIAADEFRAVIEHDPAVLMILLKTVARHLTGAVELMREARVSIPQSAGPTPPPIA
ncbi:ABC transporter transmembrane domain-containing protein [Sulfitobacter sp. LCG007]